MERDGGLSRGGVQALMGRSKHLAKLALVFHHRHGTWRDFGLFLKVLFGEAQSIGGLSAIPRHTVSCRHNEGGRHHNLLTADIFAAEPGSTSTSDLAPYQRPCISMGAFENKKNPGLVVDDLCVKARTFLVGLGKGDGAMPGGRDYEYTQASAPSQSSTMTLPPMGAEDLLDIDESSILNDPPPRAAKRARRLSNQLVGKLSSDCEGSSNYDGDSLFDDEDVRLELEETLASIEKPRSSPTVGIPTELDTGEDSGIEGGGRSASTKLRVATLAYLCRFADNPSMLREEFRRLKNSDLWVLHLCGCGLCIPASIEQPKLYGCCEPSHLTLGSSVTNAHHRTFHETIALAQTDDYPALVEIVQRATDGENIF